MSADSTDTGLTPAQLALLNPDLDLPPSSDTLFDDATLETLVAEEPAKAPEAPSEPVEATPEVTPQETPEPAQTPPEASQEDVRLSRALLEFEERNRVLAKRERELEEQQRQFEPFRQAAELRQKGDRLGAMEALGLDYTEVTQDYLAGEGANQADRLKREIQETREQFEARIQEMQQRDQDRQAAAFKDSVINYSYTAAEQFPHIAATGAHELVYDAVQTHYSRTGQVLSNEEAAAAVEEGLASLIGAVLGNETLRSKYTTSTETKSSGTAAAEVTPTTLTNKVGLERTAVVNDTFNPETATDEEMIERLAPLLQFDD